MKQKAVLLLLLTLLSHLFRSGLNKTMALLRDGQIVLRPFWLEEKMKQEMQNLEKAEWNDTKV